MKEILGEDFLKTIPIILLNMKSRRERINLRHSKNLNHNWSWLEITTEVMKINSMVSVCGHLNESHNSKN